MKFRNNWSTEKMDELKFTNNDKVYTSRCVVYNLEDIEIF